MIIEGITAIHFLIVKTVNCQNLKQSSGFKHLKNLCRYSYSCYNCF